MNSLKAAMSVVFVAPLLTYVTYSSAVKSAAGESVDVSGRRQGIKQLIVYVGETLGPAATLSIGCGVTIASVIWLAYVVMTYQPNADQGE